MKLLTVQPAVCVLLFSFLSFSTYVTDRAMGTFITITIGKKMSVTTVPAHQAYFISLYDVGVERGKLIPRTHSVIAISLYYSCYS